MTQSKYAHRQLILPGTTVGGDVGTFYVDFVIRNRTDATREVTLNGLVDTGASYTVVPEAVLDGLGIERDDAETFEFADGSRHELSFGRAEMELQGRTRDVYVVFGNNEDPILLGAMALEAFALAADAKNRTLIPGQLTI